MKMKSEMLDMAQEKLKIVCKSCGETLYPTKYVVDNIYSSLDLYCANCGKDVTKQVYKNKPQSTNHQ